ncbi:PhnD/SsuA/transferrin family substrate-binding protein [Sporolactobacillus terrae]|uniref:Phosphonate ABC transporter substrate-binding protein n=1 Tax=Sporolactobacillus terrae TaxID=269673 RepID=A0ABX5Q3X4_9BACL|nr:PhnD/SsuA/transferrin family substrate-binding protein [Sporolactobacillus terrae]QAA21327.1 phosphonate ABC transporter substrate-binding protein [Sporolactobacillus terrae]QAA24299.1 phosphonate ABC transporter substrate-binding protein [Sporolactobacillus terrae]UAK16103.1 PhnD/SsuA/transferrin family substrate-binding protein [Sporolactobacillus terrae]
MKKAVIGFLVLALFLVSAACSANGGSGSGSSAKKTITVVWYPNESGADMKSSREAIDKVIADATGKKVVDKLTTDYNIAIEAIASGNADIGFMAAQGYIEAHKKNEKVLPLVVNSGASGTLKDAVYYSWIAVNSKDADKYKSNNGYSIDGIKGKRMSFVSTSSTSGFVVPSSRIIANFKSDHLKQEDLQVGNKFFKQVVFGQSHQGSAVNLLTGKADVAAFCDTELIRYVDLANGEMNKEGSTYKVKANAEEPFNKLGGKEFTVLAVTPVLNAPVVMNTETLSKSDQKKVLDKLTSDDVANDKGIFAPEGSKGMYAKTQDERFLKIEDGWFDEIRKLSE